MKALGIFHVSDSTYEYLARCAAERNMELEDYVAKLVELVVTLQKFISYV